MSLKHDIGRAAQRRDDLCRRVLGEEIELQHDRAGHRLHRQDVGSDELTLALRRADALRRDLGPAAGRGAEIDHARAALQEMEAVVELDQLEGGARAIAEALGLGDIGIVELAREPGGRGGRALLGGLDAHRHAAPRAVALSCALPSQEP